MNGASPSHALLAQQRDELVEPLDDRLGGLLGEQPGDRQRQLAADRAVARDRDPAAERDEPLDARAPCSRRRRRPRRRCARRGRRSRRTRPRAGRSRARARRRRGPVAWWRSTTASLARSRAGSATTRPSRTAGASSAAPVISCPAIMSITRTRSPAGPRSSVAVGERRGVDGVAHPVGHGRRGERQRRAVARGDARRRRSRPPRGTTSRSSSTTRSARKPGAIAPRSASPWQRAGCSVAITSTSSGAMPCGHRLAAHRVDVALAHEHVRLAVVGAERAVLRAVAADQLQQRAQVARVGGLAQQHPEAAAALLERLLPRRRLVVGADPGRRVGVERRARARRARGRRRAGAARPWRARRGRPR